MKGRGSVDTNHKSGSASHSLTRCRKHVPAPAVHRTVEFVVYTCVPMGNLIGGGAAFRRAKAVVFT